MTRSSTLQAGCAAVLFAISFSSPGRSQEPVASNAVASAPVVVRFHEPKLDQSRVSLPIDPTMHIKLQPVSNMRMGVWVDNRMMCCGNGAVQPHFLVDGQIVAPGNSPNMPLKPGPNGKARTGFMCKHTHGNLHFTQIAEVVPSRPSDKNARRRLLDTSLIRYTIENKDSKPHRVAVRVRIDAYCVNNDGSLCASPQSHPGKILNGIELKGKNFPDYVQFLERPNLANPGFVGHFTFKVGRRLEGPNRFIVARHQFPSKWDADVVASNGDSDWYIYWESKEIPAGGKRELAYGYGRGLANDPENEGKVLVNFTGSFEPRMAFTIQAYVADPVPNQILTLQLPAGMTLLEGSRIQPVPPPAPGTGMSLVLWKARVDNLGEHSLRILSSKGVTETRTITVSKN